MPTPLSYSRFIELLKAVEQLPIPSELFNRHRMQYDFILGQINLSCANEKILSVSDLSSCSILGSQPTANKRLQELISFGLIESKEGEDRRQKILTLSLMGRQYLIACSELMAQVVNQAEVRQDCI